MKRVRLRIDGMTCSACSNSLEKYLLKQEGVIDAVVNLVLQEVSIEFEDNITINILEKYIGEAGFKSLGIGRLEDILKLDAKKNRRIIILMGVLTTLIFFISKFTFIKLVFGYKVYTLILMLLTILVMYLARDIIISGIKNISHKTPNMNSLITISVLCSFSYSIYSAIMLLLGNDKYLNYLYFDSVSMVLFFVKIGKFIEGLSKFKTMDAIKKLVQITPERALLKVGNTEKQVTIDEVKVDDILIVKPGMKIAVDGVVIKGNSYLDESFITGESMPVKKRKNDNVIAGSMNYDGVLEYKAKKIGRNSTISEIVHLVMDATNTKAPIARLADKLSSYFVPILLVIATITFVVYLLLGNTFDEAINTFVTILVVACPCALGIATPLALVVSMGVSANKGILIKSGNILEIASKVDTIIFDKTGTLTKGKLEISKMYNDSTYNDKELLRVVASIEANSNHPISYTFLEYAKNKKLKLYDVDEFENVNGIGIIGKINNDLYYLGNNKLFNMLDVVNSYIKEEKELTKLGNSIVYVIKNNKVISLIGLKDVIRDESIEVISKLKKLNKDIVMLTGDNKDTALLVSKELGINEVVANVTPKEKASLIEDLKENGKKIMMVGDGINDAPALALADIGVSLEGASDIATNTADVLILKNDLTRIVSLVIISKNTIKNIKENLFWAIIYNMCMIPIAIGLFKPFGIVLNPVMASVAMTMSSLTVVFNALRLRKIVNNI